MKKTIALVVGLVVAGIAALQAQDIETVFGKGGGSITGYGALSNKFTRIRGEYANMAEVYGGVYLNHKLFLGLGGAAVTNNLPVPAEHSAVPGAYLSYEYGQCGLVTQYVLGSNKAFHLVFHLFSGAGFTVQYDRYGWDDDFDEYLDDHSTRDENWFVVAEPGIQLEVNLTRWMRFSPGVTYRAAFGSEGRGLSDSDISDLSYNATLKFGRF